MPQRLSQNNDIAAWLKKAPMAGARLLVDDEDRDWD